MRLLELYEISKDGQKLHSKLVEWGLCPAQKKCIICNGEMNFVVDTQRKMLIVTEIAVAIGACYAIRRLILHFWTPKHHLPPGPRGWPIVGNLPDLDPTGAHKTLNAWGRQYGGIFTYWRGSMPVIVLTRFDLIREAFVKQGDNFSARPINFFQCHFKKRLGIVGTDGPLWREQRRFAVQTLKEFGLGKSVMEEKIREQTKNLIDWITQDFDEGNGNAGIVRFEEKLALIGWNIISELVIGQSFEKDSVELRELRSTLERRFHLSAVKSSQYLMSFPWLRNIPLLKKWVRYEEIATLQARVQRFLIHLTERAKSQFDPDPHMEPTNYAHAFLKEIRKRESEGNAGTFTESQWMMAVKDLWQNGLETTVATISWAVLLMIRHHDIQEKVYGEVTSVTKSERLPSLSDRQDLPYTMATLNEVHRWANIVPINFEHTVFEDTKLCGYDIPRGCYVIAQISAVHSDPKLFPDPERFDPSRFLSKTDPPTLLKIPELQPFSMGKRQCPGESLARTEFFLIFTALLQTFQFASIPGEESPDLTPTLGVTPHPFPYRSYVSMR